MNRMGSYRFVDASVNGLRRPTRERVKYDHWLNVTLYRIVLIIVLQMVSSNYSNEINTMCNIALRIGSLARRLN